MAEVTYKISSDQKPTKEDIEMIRNARVRQDELLAQGKKSEVYDEDSPENSPEASPVRYQAMMNAVGERNRRIAKRERKRA